MVHREHNPRSGHSHNKFHKRQAAGQSSESVTQVTRTISVIQEVDIDSNGSTVGVETVLADNTSVEAPTGLSVVGDSVSSTVLTGAQSPSTTAAQPASTTNPPSNTGLSSATTQSSAADSIATSQSLAASQSAATASTSVPLESASAFTSIAAHNSTSLSVTFSTSNSPNTFINSTSTSTSSSILATLSSSSTSSITSPLLSTISISSISSSLLSSSETSFTSSSSSITSVTSTSSSTSPTSTITGTDGGIIGATGTQTSSTGSSTAAAGGAGGSSDDSTSPSTGAIAGGVVGGIAGIAVLLFIAMLILRWKKRNQSQRAIENSAERDGGAGTSASAGDGIPRTTPPASGAMAERSLPFAIPAALASLTGYKRVSHQPSVDASSTAGSERGFYRVSGRKIQSVLESGGDGYGDQEPRDTFSGSSFYRDSQGFYGGAGGPQLSPLAGPSIQPITVPSMQPMNRDSDIPVFSRPSPARTPVINQGPFAGPPSPMEPPRRPDGLGRSHPSQDGSHGSRFTEEV